MVASRRRLAFRRRVEFEPLEGRIAMSSGISHPFPSVATHLVQALARHVRGSWTGSTQLVGPGYVAFSDLKGNIGNLKLTGRQQPERCGVFLAEFDVSPKTLSDPPRFEVARAARVAETAAVGDQHEEEGRHCRDRFHQAQSEIHPDQEPPGQEAIPARAGRAAHHAGAGFSAPRARAGSMSVPRSTPSTWIIVRASGILNRTKLR